jgi:hypothetical protein
MALFHACLCFAVDTFSEFDKNCQVNTFEDRNCSFSVTNNWNFLRFREWLEKINGHIGNVGLDLTCKEGGSVFLPWPFRARNLRKIHVRNCLIDGYYSEISVSKYPNTLHDMTLVDVTILTDINDILERSHEPLVKSSQCGQETAFRFIERNVRFSFVPFKGNIPLSRLSEAFKSLAEKSKTQPFTCNFENLVYLEETGSKSISKLRFESMGDHSVYPKLRVFNFSSNYFPRIPKQLTRWFQVFPSLRALDLSNNTIREFSFERPDVSQNKSLYISLANNNITSVPADLATYLSGRTPILMNLLGNPIHCDCRASVLSQYLKALRKKAPQHKALTNVQCHSPHEFAGRKVRTVNFKNCK